MRTAIPHKKTSRWWLAGRLLVCASALATAGAPDLPLGAQAPARQLVVFGNDEYAPLSYLDGDVPKGLDVDLVRAVSAAMERELRLELMDWNVARERVLRGEADALIDLARDDERNGQWEFAEPIITHDFGLFVRDTEVAIRSADDLVGRRVGAARGGLSFEFLRARGGVDLTPISGSSEGFDLLRSGDIDAIAGDTWVLAYTAQRRGIAGVARAGEPFITRRSGLAVRKGRGELVAEMNRAIRTLEADGTLSRIRNEWRPQEVLFVSRERVRYYVTTTIAAFVLLIVGALALWIWMLKRQIRQRRAVEAALTENQERLGMALSSAEMGTWSWTPAAGSGTRDAGMNEMLGLAPVESAVGWQEWFAPVHEEDRAATEAQFERAIAGGEAFSSQYRIVRPDGGVRWLHSQGKPLHGGSSGGVSSVTGVAFDATDLTLAEAALRGSEEKFYKAFNSSPDCIGIQDLDSLLFLEVNQRFEAMSGYTRGELIGSNLLELGVADISLRKEVMRQLEATGSLRNAEFDFRHKNGSIRTALISAELMTLNGRRCALYVARDVTDQKRLEAHLRRASEINKLFVSELDPQALYAAITQSLSGVVDVDYAGLVLNDRGSNEIQLQAQTFYDGRGILVSRQAVGAGTALAQAALGRGDVTVFGVDDLTSLGEPVAPILAEGLRSVCCVPLGGRRGSLGVLVVGSRRESAFSGSDVEVLRQLSTFVGIAIENAQTHEEVTRLKNQLAEEKLYLEEEIRVDHNFRDIVGSSPALKRVLQEIETVARTDSTVLLLGETGTGKELLARAVHELSVRKDHTFVRVNAAALPATLLESELFGYERGAFTGAVASRIGRFELAHRGTLFLDEVGDIPVELQPKLLRAIQEREFERLGGTHSQRVDVRLIAATNRDLEAMVKEGTFRSDLFYRLNVFPIRVPALRERPEDIPLLVRHFVRMFSLKMKRQIDTIPASTMTALQQWHWPGNVRELANLIERAVIVSTGRVLQVQLPDPIPLAEVPVPGRPPAAPPVRPTLADAERETILRALREANGIIAGEAGAAARLGMKRTTLQSKMRKLGIRRPSF